MEEKGEKLNAVTDYAKVKFYVKNIACVASKFSFSSKIALAETSISF